ncbi:MAG: major facilitator superfamily domain-containing protein 1 [Deltaproteobacteria bacterium]|nr:major facilitator superfamily domain-containing protein 1 [Deltaproteobacteria bacterium]
MSATLQERTAGGAAPLAPPRIFRWLVLIVISLAMFGNYYVYDCISPLADVLKEKLSFTDDDIGMLNAIYSIPNIFMVLIGGIVIDRLGVKRSLLLFSGICMVGAGLTAATGTFSMMAAGRLLFGLGAESLIVAVTASIARWFSGKELSFAFGINLTIARLGSFAALNSPTWAKQLYGGWQWPLLLAAVFGLVSAIAALSYWVMESYAGRRYELSQSTTDKVVWRDLFRFGRSYWFVVALCVTFYSAIFPFQTFAVKFFMEAHSTSRELGGFLSSMLTLFAMIFTPLFGLLVDRVGRRSAFMMAGSLLIVPVYLAMAYTRSSVWLEVPQLGFASSFPNLSLLLPMATMGIAFSLIPAVMWPSVAYIVDQSRLGTAYGMMTMIQNIGLAGFNLLIGRANTFAGASAANPDGYALGMWIFSVLGLLGFLFAWLLRRNEMGPHAYGLETITVRTGNPAAG